MFSRFRETIQRRLPRLDPVHLSPNGGSPDLIRFISARTDIWEIVYWLGSVGRKMVPSTGWRSLVSPTMYLSTGLSWTLKPFRLPWRLGGGSTAWAVEDGRLIKPEGGHDGLKLIMGHGGFEGSDEDKWTTSQVSFSKNRKYSLWLASFHGKEGNPLVFIKYEFSVARDDEKRRENYGVFTPIVVNGHRCTWLCMCIYILVFLYNVNKGTQLDFPLKFQSFTLGETIWLSSWTKSKPALTWSTVSSTDISSKGLKG
jgi:hypothetical protein